MTTQTETPSLAELQRQKELADAEAAKVGAKVADAMARAEAAQAQIQAIHRARIEQWARDVVDGDAQARKDARARIHAAREAFARAVADGDPAFLQRYLDIVRATASYYALNRHLMNAHYELGTQDPRIPELGRLGQVPTFAEALEPAMNLVIAALVSDAEDAVFAEHRAVVEGDDEEVTRGK